MKPLQIGINTYSYAWSHSLQDCLEQLNPLGYQIFEGLINPPHLDLELSSADRRALRDYMEGEGLSLTSLNLPSLDTNLASPFAYTREYSITMFQKALALAADLGSPLLVTVPGRVNPLLPCPSEKSKALVQDTIGSLIPFARDLGIGLAVENVPFAALPRARDIRELLDDMGNEDVLCACYDVANAHFIGESPEEGVDSLGSQIKLVHCSDTTRDAWRHDSVGKGDVPFERLGAALQTQGYGGPILLEIIDRDPLSSILHSHDSLAEHGLVAHRKP